MDKFVDVNQNVIDFVFANSDLRNLILKNRKLLMLKFLKRKICNIITNDMSYRCMRAAGLYGWCEQSIRVFNNNINKEIEWCRESEPDADLSIHIWDDDISDYLTV